jgi:cytidylate kinase
MFIRSIYGKEWDDPNEYDIVFDTIRRDEEEIIRVIETIS